MKQKETNRVLHVTNDVEQHTLWTLLFCLPIFFARVNELLRGRDQKRNPCQKPAHHHTELLNQHNKIQNT